MRSTWVATIVWLALSNVPVHAQKPAPQAIELVGKATDFHFTRNWNSYYWREDFTFVLKDEKSGKSWRILSREPTPAYDWRMGTTFTALKPDWSKQLRVKIIGVTGVDRLPATFYDFKLNEPNLATAHLVYAYLPSPPGRGAGGEGAGAWKLYNANNWFHKWSEQADPIIYSHYANKQAPYDIYGFINGQAAPFSAKSQEIIAKHKSARMFHGVIRTAKNQKFGYEIDVLHLVGPDKGGNGVVFHGDPKTLVPLDRKK
ncbi:MAG: hypothetical protein FJ303_22910 [Planctomycetes bacterium]|nr:hypothetical protein [Planctomycetota bacterium]